MRVPLIGMRDANSPQDCIYPALDSATHVVFTAEDGTPAVHKLHEIKCMDMLTTKQTDFPFVLEGAPDTWEVFVTDQRIVVRNPYTVGLFKKAKEKPGKASVGQMPYRAVTYLAAFFDNQNAPILICSCVRRDGTRSAIAMNAGNVENAKILAKDLFERIDHWIIATKRKFAVVDGLDKNRATALADWDAFLDRAWEVPNVTVLAPCESTECMPNSNL